MFFLFLQRIIDELFQYTERLQERKADRENVATEMDIKADKHALDGKVNQSTFDETFQMFDRGRIGKRKVQQASSGNLISFQYILRLARRVAENGRLYE